MTQAATAVENVQDGPGLQLVIKIKRVEELTANPALQLYLFGGKKKKKGSVSAMVSSLISLRRVGSLLPQVSPVLVDGRFVSAGCHLLG